MFRKYTYFTLLKVKWFNLHYLDNKRNRRVELGPVCWPERLKVKRSIVLTARRSIPGVPKGFSLDVLRAEKAGTSVRLNGHEPLAAHVSSFELADPIRNTFDKSRRQICTLKN